MTDIKSMTGYASKTLTTSSTTLSIDIRAVNHRNLDVSFRVPDELRPAENSLKKIVTSEISRGKIECRVTLKTNPEAETEFQVNRQTLFQIVKICGEIKEIIPSARSISLGEVIRWPGAIEENTDELNDITQKLQKLMAATVSSLIEEKAREGVAMGKIIDSKIEKISKLMMSAEQITPNIINKTKDRIIAKFEEAKVQPDPERLHQELVFLATKLDTDEEIQRSKVHLNEMKKTIKKGGVCGKKLDFLAQELNRETNTLSSKSSDLSITEIAIEIKTLLEQIREQIQNIE